MAEKISDSVGKKIVEALKMQNGGTSVVEETVDEVSDFEETSSDSSFSDNFDEKAFSEPISSIGSEDNIEKEYQSPISFGASISSQSAIDSAFTQSLNDNLAGNFSSLPANIEYPANIAVLNSLIAKLPTGVSKQTGALIIRQTMEALGISMQAVIQEAKQVQDDLTSRARECQKNIIDYRKQISMLELQAQQYQRQAVAMNDIIGLFAHSK